MRRPSLAVPPLFWLVSWLLPWLFLALLTLLGLRGSDPGEGASADLATARPPIVCVSGQKYTRCPSDCEAGPRGEAHCRCQDFYLRRGAQPLRYSHKLCR